MADKKTAERQRRYRIREQARSRALFAGATEIDIAWFGTNADGEHVAIDYDGKPIPLIVRTPTPVDAEPVTTQVDPRKPAKPSKVYAPRSWEASKWNRVVEQLRAQHYSKENALSEMNSGATLDDKQKRHAVAVIDATPDVPDWYDHLPTAEEKS